MKCVCGSEHVTKQGTRPTRFGKTTRFQCQECGRWLSLSPKVERIFTEPIVEVII